MCYNEDDEEISIREIYKKDKTYAYRAIYDLVAYNSYHYSNLLTKMYYGNLPYLTPEETLTVVRDEYTQDLEHIYRECSGTESIDWDYNIMQAFLEKSLRVMDFVNDLLDGDDLRSLEEYKEFMKKMFPESWNAYGPETLETIYDDNEYYDLALEMMMVTAGLID